MAYMPTHKKGTNLNENLYRLTCLHRTKRQNLNLPLHRLRFQNTFEPQKIKAFFSTLNQKNLENPNEIF